LDISIRPFKIDDLRDVNEIEKDSFSDPWPSTFFYYLYNKASHLFLVAEVEGELVGYIIGEIREAMFGGCSERLKTGHIMNIAVNKELRNQGIGSRLIEMIEKGFREKDASQAVLEVRESNKLAKTFYVEKGWNEIDRVRAYYSDEDAIIMRKRFD
jgi:ribosomal-protein-alanine N-acetyltransferase